MNRKPAFSRLRAFAAAATIAVGQPAAAFEMPPFVSAHYRDHPLAGTIWTGAGGAVDGPALDAAVGAARYVVIGEIHNNPDHHAIQAALLGAIAAAGRRPAVVFEMIPADLRPALDAYLAAPGRTAAGLGAAVEWEKRGWPDFALYRPIVEVALSQGLAILPGDLARATIRKIGREGAAALSPDAAARLGLDRPMPDAAREELSRTLRESHCGMLPDAAVGPMLTVQRARDGALADAMIAAAGEAGSAVLITGAGHARKDWAAPAVIGARAPEAGIVAIGLMEVAEGEDALADYGIGPDTPAPYDFVVFTPRADLADPCAGLAETLRKRAPAGR